MSIAKVFLAGGTIINRAVNQLSMSTEREITKLTQQVKSAASVKLPFFESTYTASTVGVAFTTSASYTSMLSFTATVAKSVDAFAVRAVACIACPNATATVCLRLLAGSTTLFEEPLIAGTAYSSHALEGVYEPTRGEVPVFSLQIKRTAGDGDVNRTALGIYTQRGYA